MGDLYRLKSHNAIVNASKKLITYSCFVTVYLYLNAFKGAWILHKYFSKIMPCTCTCASTNPMYLYFPFTCTFTPTLQNKNCVYRLQNEGMRV